MWMETQDDYFRFSDAGGASAVYSEYDPPLSVLYDASPFAVFPSLMRQRMGPMRSFSRMIPWALLGPITSMKLLVLLQEFLQECQLNYPTINALFLSESWSMNFFESVLVLRAPSQGKVSWGSRFTPVTLRMDGHP